MDLISIISRFEEAVSKFEDTNRNIERESSIFDEALGISKEQHSEVVNLIDSYEDSTEAIDQFKDQITKCDDAITTLTANLKKKGLSKDEKDIIKNDINREKEKKDRLENALATEDKSQRRREKRLKDKFGIADVKTAIGQKNAMQQKIATLPKGGGMAKAASALKGLKGNPYVMAVQMLVKAVEFGIGKATEYMKVGYENQMKAMQAITTVSVNSMKSNLASWVDAVDGAYEAQSNAIASDMAVIDAANQIELANTKLANTWTNWIPIWGTLNKYQEEYMAKAQELQILELKNAQELISQANGFTKKTDEYIKKQDHSIHSFQKVNSFSSSQTEVFEKRMLNEGEAFAQLNRKVEDALKVQMSVQDQGGRNINYSQNDYEKTLATGSLVGDENVTNFQAQMQTFNYSISSAADIMYELYRDVNKMGMSQKKVTKDVLANLKLANKYDFKTGVKGFIEMSKWAENVKFNMGSLGNMIEKVQSGGLEGVITQAAKLQVLGGNFAMGADPLRMAWEANNSPEDYAKSVEQSFRGLGITDQTTGETKFSMGDNLRIRAAAEQYGMTTEDAKNMIRERGKKEVVKKQIGNSALSPEQLDAVANKAQRNAETGRWEVTTIDGKKMDVADVQAGDLENLLSGNNEEDSVKYAKSTMSFTERIASATEQINAKLGNATFDNYSEAVKGNIQTLIDGYTKNLAEVTSAINTNREAASKEQKEMIDKLKTINTDLQGALDTVARAKAEAIEAYNQLKNDVETKKAEIGAAETKYKERTNNLNAVWEQKSDGYIDNFSRGQDLNTARAKYFSSKADKQKAEGDYIGYGWNKFNAGIEQTLNRAVMGIGNALGFDANSVVNFTTGDWFNDGISVADGTPMMVEAKNVTSVQDGAATIAKTDPKDTAIFAKTGGPFDTLFNGIFDKINDVYESYNSTNLYGNTKFSMGDRMRIEAYADTIGLSTDNIMGQIRQQRRDAGIEKGIVMPKPMPYSNEFPIAPMPSNNGAIQSNDKSYNTPNTLQKGSFDINIHGDLNLKSNGQSIDIIKELKNDPLLIRAITQMISDSISAKINGGRTVFNGNDLTYFRK